MQLNAVGALLAKARHPVFARQAYAIDTGSGSGVKTCVDEPIHLPSEGRRSAERPRIECLHKDRCAPSLGGIGAPQSREPGGHCLDQ